MSEHPLIGKIRNLRPALASEMKISRVRVFGSFARGEEKPDSDIDLLVDFSEVPGLIRFAGIQRQLSEKLGRRVDLVTPEALHPLLKEQILHEAVDVWQ